MSSVFIRGEIFFFEQNKNAVTKKLAPWNIDIFNLFNSLGLVLALLKSSVSRENSGFPAIRRAYFLKVIIISRPLLNWLPDMAYITGIL